MPGQTCAFVGPDARAGQCFLTIEFWILQPFFFFQSEQYTDTFFIGYADFYTARSVISAVYTSPAIHEVQTCCTTLSSFPRLYSSAICLSGTCGVFFIELYRLFQTQHSFSVTSFTLGFRLFFNLLQINLDLFIPLIFGSRFIDS
jgi:hypothetical protein